MPEPSFIAYVYIPEFDCSLHFPTFMASLNHTQTVQPRANLPSTNPNVQGYAIQLLSTCIFHSVSVRLGLTALRFYRTPVCWWGNQIPHFVLQVLNKCALAPLIAYSTKVQWWFYFPLLSQLAVIIFAIWLCRGRNQLSLSDVEFAIIQTQSPVSIYVLLLVIPHLFFQWPGFKKDAMSNSNNSQSFCSTFSLGNIDWEIIWSWVLGLLYMLCCLSVNLIHQFDKTGYIHVTQTAKAPDPIPSPSLIWLEGMPDGKAWLRLAVCSIFIYECMLHQHGEEQREIMHQLVGKYLVACNSFCALRLMREYESRETKEVFESMAIEQVSQVHLLLIHQLAPEIHCLLCRWGFSATWYVLTNAMIINLWLLTRFIVTKLHPWLPFLYVLVMFLNWSRDMKIWTIEDGFQWTFGQWASCSNQLKHLISSFIIAPCNLPSCYYPIPMLTTVLQQLAGDSTPSTPSYFGCDLADFRKGWTMDHPYRVQSDPQKHVGGIPTRCYTRGNWLRTTTPAPPLGVANPVSSDQISTRCIHSRHRRNCTNQGPRSENVADILREEDIADQVRDKLTVLGWN